MGRVEGAQMKKDIDGGVEKPEQVLSTAACAGVLTKIGSGFRVGS